MGFGQFYRYILSFQQQANKLGLMLFRPESLNASPLLIETLADLASHGLAQLRAISPTPETASA